MKPLIIAHRGESFKAPENTLASINLAWKKGADAVEIDVHLSKDNHVVVIHDSTLKRFCGINKKVKNLTLSELKNFDVGLWKSIQFENEKIPTLKEVLYTIPNNGKLIIEIKCDSKILPHLKKDLESSNVSTSQVEIISFKFRVLKKAKKIMSHYKILYLVNFDYNLYTRLLGIFHKKLISKVKKANLDGFNVCAGKILTPDFVKKIKSANLLLYVWTVDDPEYAKKLNSFGIDGITSNKASWIKSII
ncbi:MAG: glycerophosphodiester phosphodiesterase [Ignavibacteriae bacterium]|nr:glycerophosphodiester phosphodiesterase [Ignavibacteriota bacterium]